MGVFKCRVGFVWSLLFAVVIAVIPRYWELKIESIQPLPSVAAAIPDRRILASDHFIIFREPDAISRAILQGLETSTRTA